MDLVTLQKGNELQVKIAEFNAALNCFLWDPEAEDSETNTRWPRLAIEFDADDGDGRDMIKLPMNLNEGLIAFLKSEIKKERDALVEEFNAL